jgi:hypothetical protein
MSTSGDAQEQTIVAEARIIDGFMIGEQRIHKPGYFDEAMPFSAVASTPA